MLLRTMFRSATGIAILALVMGHDHGGCGAYNGAPTEATCDPRLRWDNFGSDFMGRYCTSCHSTRVQGGQRHGAPTDHNYDTQAGVQVDPEHVEEAAGAGPAATNVYMPPYGPTPTQSEREQLAQWLACGAP